jgi:hypothetical protein
VTHGAESTARARRYEQRPEAVDGLPERGNVFRDLGFSGDEAEYVKVRVELIVNLQSDLMRGRIDLFSIDTLIDMPLALSGGTVLRNTEPGRPPLLTVLTCPPDVRI